MLKYLSKATKHLSYSPLRSPLQKLFFSTSKLQSALPLLRCVKQEIHEQQSKNLGSEAILNSIKKQKWQVVSKDTFVQMTKNHPNDTTIKVVFTIEPPRPEEQILVTGELNQKPTSFGDYQEFSVYLKKPGFDKTLYVDYFFNDDDLRIIGLNFTNDYDQHKQIVSFNRGKQTYQGPNIISLPKNLSTTIHDYFEELGITNELASFIGQYSLNEQHFMYLKWLKDLESFVEQQ